MPWWALGYVILYAGIGVAAAIDEYRSGNGLGWAVGELLATVLGSLFVWALWHRSLQSGLGKAVLPLFVGVLVWEIVSAAHDLSAEQPNGELSPAADRAAHRLGVLLALLLVAPALAAGAWLCWRALNA
ncbi:MAG: hypothetical protein ACAI18_00845 [Gemmatimonadales bacterium]